MRVDVAYVLLTDPSDERVLLVQNERFWSLPGGKREDGETLAAAAAREAKEETGYDVAVGDLVHVSEKVVGADWVVFFTFRGTITGGTMGTADHEIQQIAWRTFAEAEALMPYHQNLRGLLRCAARYAVE